MKEALGAKDGPPLSLEPFYEAADRVNDSGGVRLLVNSWAKYVEKARYGKKEPNEREAGAVERLVEIVVLTCVRSFFCRVQLTAVAWRLNGARKRMDDVG